MPFVLVGLSQRTAPVEVREQAFVPEGSVGACVRRLLDRDLIEAGVLLSTCHRTELYAVAARADADDRLLLAFGDGPHQLDFGTWRGHAYHLAGRPALEHLFRVAAGLDSMVVGEGQVLGQLKRALDLALQAGTLDPALHVILRGAIRAGKRVRHETDLGRHAMTVSHAAVAQARETFGDLAGRGVVLVGAGTMSEVALRLLRNQGIRQAYVVSRTIERAERVARPAGAQAIELSQVEAIAGDIDIIISSSNAPSYLIDPIRAGVLQDRRGHRPLLVIDIAIPRDVDPDVAQIPGVRLFNIDDLRTIAEANMHEREGAIPAAQRIVDAELDRTEATLTARDSADAISALVAHGHRLREQELARAIARLPEADDATRAAMRRLAEGLTARFLDAPVRHLRQAGDAPVDQDVLRQAFGLGRGDARPAE